MTEHTTDRILFALYCFSRDTCRIDATQLARSVGVTATQAAKALVELERAGLVDATRARLTMLGLAKAVALGARSSGGPQVDLRHAQPRLPPIAAGGLAARAAPAQSERSKSEVTAPRTAADDAMPDAPKTGDSDPFGFLDTPAHGEH